MIRLGAAILALLSGVSVYAQNTVSLYFAGDMMQHEAQLHAAFSISTQTYSYKDCFEYVKPEINGSDISICNFETTMGCPPFTGYPSFCSPTEYAEAIQEAGFDIFLTANNHCMDRRTRGVIRTLDILDSLGIGHLGTYRNQAERDSLYPYILEHDGIRIALLNYTYDTNGIPVKPPVIVNLIDTAMIAADIRRARELQAECIIACMHWGTEYRTQPDNSQKQLEEWLYAVGVDHIIGGHPHVAQPVQTRPDVRGYAGEHLTVWSLGNYISNMSAPGTDRGLAVSLELKRFGKIVHLSDYKLYRNRTVRPEFKVIPQ